MVDAVGNDIVWLADPANVGRFADKKLLHRILTPAERLLVGVSPDPDFMLWSLWAAKEAAYKAWAQALGPSGFSPASFTVEFSPGEGVARVVKAGLAIPIRWTRGADWVHALAAEDPDAVVVSWERSESDPSSTVRRVAERALRQAGGPEAAVQGRPPRFVAGASELDVSLSLSHDGPYVAVAFRWRK